MRVRLILSLSSLALLSAASPASAHLRLVDPKPRYPAPAAQASSDMLKDGPCGVTGDQRTTDMTRVTTYTPGQTITVKWNETVEHPGHYRIAFDDDGQNFVNPTSATDIQVTPVLPVLKDGIMDADPSNANQMVEAQVTLPNINCDKCTLQVIQLMTDKDFADAFYYQCADIKIEGPLMGGGGAGGAGGGGGGTGGMSGGMGGSVGGAIVGGTGNAGTPTTGGGGSGTAGTGVQPMGGTGTGGTGVVTTPPADDGGCSIGRVTGNQGGLAALGAGLLLGLGWFARRRQRAL